MNKVSVRYIADDVDAAVEFYTRHLDFKVQMRPRRDLQRSNVATSASF